MDKKLNILLSAYVCAPNRGSEPGYAWNLACHLARRGHNVHVLTRTYQQFDIQQELSDIGLPNLKFHFLDIPRLGIFLRRRLPFYIHYFLWQYSALSYANLLCNYIDLVHHVTWGSLRVSSYMWKTGKPFVFGPVGGGQVANPSFSEFFGEYWAQEWLRTLQIRALPYLPSPRRMAQKTDLFLAANMETLDQIKKMKARQVKLFCDSALPEQFGPKNFSRPTSSEYLRILWVGRIYPIKGLNFALFALKKMKIPFKLTILGDGPLSSKIPEWLARYGLQNKVDYKGQVDWETVKGYYATQDVFLFTSLRESFGGQLLEAMAYGLPIVTLDQFGARDFVPDQAGFKVAVTTKDQTANLLANALECLWNEPELRVNMGLVGYHYAKNQTWSKKVVEIERIYHEVLKMV